MRKRSELTEEEYFKIKRGNLKKIAALDTFLLVAGIFYMYMLNASGGALALWGTGLILSLILGKMFSLLPEVLFKGRIGRQFYPKWVAFCCERLPKRLKKKIERDCAKQPGLQPEEALLRLSKKRKRISSAFDLVGAICLIKMFFSVPGLFSEEQIGHFFNAVLHNEPLIYRNINTTPYQIVFLISLPFFIVAVICAVIYRIRSHAEEVGKAGGENADPADIERADRIMTRLRGASLISFGIFLVMYLGMLLVFFISITHPNPMREIVLANENVEGFSYSEEHELKLKYSWEHHPAGTDFFFLANGDYVNHDDSLAQTANWGFDQILDGARGGGLSCVLETYVKKEDDHHNVYMRVPTNAEPIYYTSTAYENDYPSILTPAQFLSSLSADDLVGTAELDGVTCELYKTTVNSPALKDYLRYEVDRYMTMSSEASYYSDYGLTDGLTIPLQKWMPQEREPAKSDAAGAEICVWIESGTKLVRRVGLNATVFGSQYIEELFGKNASRFTVSCLRIAYEYSDYGKKDITVPEELIAVSKRTAN